MKRMAQPSGQDTARDMSGPARRGLYEAALVAAEAGRRLQWVNDQRQRLGLSIERLAVLAGASRSHLGNVLAGRVALLPALEARLRDALRRETLVVQGGPEADTMADMVFRLALLAVALDEGADPARVLASDPARRATSDPEWLRASRLRERALYIANVGCGISMRALAKAAGVTPAAVSQAIQRAEEARGDDADDRLLRQVEAALGRESYD